MLPRLLSLAFLIPFAALAQDYASHPPLRPLFFPSDQALGDGPHFFVSPEGDNASSGEESAPWQTIDFALTRIGPGDTLILREGVYRENVRISLTGKHNAEITIRSFPGEHAIIDGSFAEFFDAPETAWEVVDEELGEYRSASRYSNLRNVLGSFGDSMIGLQTYYHSEDLRATNEVVDWVDWDRRDETDIRPVYFGPGLWYNKESGRIHIRLAHTNLPEPIANYKGETDPRKLPLLIAPYRSTPLAIDGASHLYIEGLTIRGAGYTAVELAQATNIQLQNLTIWAGAYGIRASGTQHFRLLHSGVYGNIAPWTFRADGSKRDYPGRPHRNISRLNTHASIEIDSGRESSVYAFPQNDHWEILYCEFTDAHDGPYLGSINVHFSQNLVENMQDDGIYLSPMYKRHRLEDSDPQIYIEGNLFRQVLTPLAFGGPWTETRDQVYIYRNVFDLRKPVQTGRPTTMSAEPRFSTGKFMGDHGSPPWPAMNIYQNTIITGDPQRGAPGAAFGGLRAGNPRRIYNNIFLHLARLPGFIVPPPDSDFASDGNLYWSPDPEIPDAARFFGKFRAAFPSFEGKSLIADPKLEGSRPSADSQVVDAGVELPDGWPDDRSIHDVDAPDIGAISPAGTPRIGRGSRIGTY
ncbi:MAG: hypothetical protein ACI8UO_003068 [Verrucomicrobiales bacterium]|jgi:hypothetical protein